MNRLLRSACAASMVALAGAGCGLKETRPERGLFVEAGPDTTAVWGISWDPEAFLFTAGACGPECPAPPMLAVGDPLYLRSVVAGTQVEVFDPARGAPTLRAAAPAGPDGTWKVLGVPSRSAPPYLLLASGGKLAGGGDVPVPLPPVPPATRYLPTLALRPIKANYSYCAFQQAPVLGDTGVLEAVAKYLTAKGTPTRVDDLLDPRRWRHVSVWFLYQPDLPIGAAPAAGTTVKSNQGQVLNLAWRPPGDAGLAAPLKALQSRRGFVVDDSTSASPIGLAVVLVPASAPAGEVTVTASDTVQNPKQGRPWTSPPISLPQVPGVVSLATLQLTGPADPTEGMDLPYLCLPH